MLAHAPLAEHVDDCPPPDPVIRLPPPPNAMHGDIAAEESPAAEVHDEPSSGDSEGSETEELENAETQNAPKSTRSAKRQKTSKPRLTRDELHQIMVQAREERAKKRASREDEDSDASGNESESNDSMYLSVTCN